jgi:hypothetical protein
MSVAEKLYGAVTHAADEMNIPQCVFEKYKICPIIENYRLTILASDRFIHISHLLSVSSEVSYLWKSSKKFIHKTKVGRNRNRYLSP